LRRSTAAYRCRRRVENDGDESDGDESDGDETDRAENDRAENDSDEAIVPDRQ
jgi:hypothetical protein